jgi:biopolymer transport protein ExbD
MALKSRNKVSAQFSMSSMTDIVFLLLIFFMLTSTLVTTNALDIVLPKSSAGPIVKQSVSVSISEDLVYHIDKEEFKLELIESELIKRMAGADEKTLVLRAAESVDLGQAVEIMDIAYRNQFKIVLATQKKK